MSKKTTPDRRRFFLFPRTLASCVEPLTRPVFAAKGLAGSRLITEWERVVGPALAARAIPQKLAFAPGKTTGGTLTIAVENGFATEIQHMQPVILERLATYFGYKAVDRLVITHHFKQAVRAQAPRRTAKKPLPADCAAMADGVEDPDLKAALQSLAGTLSQ